MNRFLTFSAVALATVMCIPALSAGWGSYGGSEPDTKYDQTGGYMWQTAPNMNGDTATNKVYFNVYAAQGPHDIVAVNSATLGSRIYATPAYAAFNAILGVWVDCNHDGFIGLADGAMLEYTAQESAAAGHPVDTTICPPTDDTAAHAGTIHNNGGWITELIPILPRKDIGGDSQSDADNATNYRVLVDPGAKMWGDRVEPKTPDTAPTGSGCTQVTLIPVFGYRDTSSTGGILRHFDCLDGHAPDGARNLVASSVPALAPYLPTPSALYGDGGALNVSTFGTDVSCKDGRAQPCGQGNSNAIVYNEVDCSGKYAVNQHQDLGDPTGGTLGDQWVNVSVRAPGTPYVNPSGTVPATINETHEESPLDDCNSNDDFGHDFYGNSPVESTGAGGVAVVGKTSSELNFEYFETPAQRGSCTADTAWHQLVSSGSDPIPGDPVIPAETCGMPSNAGLIPGELGTSILFGGSTWWSSSQYMGASPFGIGSAGLDRSTVPPSASPNLVTAEWSTFYAFVTPNSLSVPGGTGTYGTEWCTSGMGAGAGIQNGWDCNPNDWNVDASTGGKVANADYMGTVGGPYNLRDVECADGTLVGAGSTANPTHQDVGPRSVSAVNTDKTAGCS